MSATHKTVPTPNPAERSLVVTVSEDTFASVGGLIPTQGTLYNDPLFKTYFGRDYMKSFSDFVYTGQVSDYGLAFARNKTVAVANVPFRSSNWKANHRWPPIVLFVAITEDFGDMRSFPAFSGTNVGTGFAPTYYDSVAYIPDVSEGTRFIKDEFFGPTQFNIPQTPVPVPTSINYILPGGGGQSFPECLHPTIEIPPMITGLTSIIAGSAAGIGTSLEGQIFPATNFTDWSPYVLSDTQEQRDGGWYRVRIRVFPPAQPEVVLMKSR